MTYLGIQNRLNEMHSFLMKKGIPYKSVSVIHRHQDLGFHVIFSNDVRELVTPEIKDGIKNREFTYHINK